MNKENILFIDDDPNIQTVVKQYLEEDGYTVYVASTGAESLGLLQKEKIDLILLDMVLPDTDGLRLLKQFNGYTKAPIIVVSGKGDATDKIVGLEMGADDYMVKPFHLRELSARIKTVLRRSHEPAAVAVASNGHTGAAVNGATNAKQPPVRLMFDGWVMDCRKYEVKAPDGQPVSFTSGEFEMLLALVQSAHKILSRDRLFEITRGVESEAYDRAVDIQIGRLRKKLNDDPKASKFIKTVRGVGYMFIAEVTRAD